MYKKRSVLNSPRLKEIKKKRHLVLRNKILLYFLGFVIIVTGLSFLSKWKKINIDKVEVIGSKVVDEDKIKELATNNLAGKYYWLFSKSNSLIYPKNTIKDELASTFNRLNDISFNVKDMKTLQITVSERKAIYTWCGENLPMEGTKLEEVKCYFTDETGYVFDEAPYFSGEVYFRFFGKLEGTNTDSPTGSYFSSEKFKNFVIFVESLSSMGLEPSLLFAKENNDVEIYLSGEEFISSATKIIFKHDADLNLVAENLQAAITTEPLKENLTKKSPPLSYIDLRFGNKVYFK